MSKISQIAVIDLIPLLLVNIVIVLQKRLNTFDHKCHGSTFHGNDRVAVLYHSKLMDISRIPNSDWDILDKTVVLISFLK